MKKFTGSDKEAKSEDLVNDNILKLKALFPELITESTDGISINVDVLKQLVGDRTLADADEKYGLNWHGKRRARQVALTPSTGTLRPCPEDSVDWEKTKNLMIEGDNLEVLKLLQKSYTGKVKLIYIDPPYNTGKDFVYPDNFKDTIKNYLELTGQAGEAGAKLTSNSESSGRYHTEWLNMMYPRLKLARNLLREDGVLFVSIDDCEVQRLRGVMDEIFGEENFFAQIPWQSRTSVQNDTDLSEQHEYLVAYAKVRRGEHRRLKESNADKWFDLPSFAAYPVLLDQTRYSNPDNDPRGPWKADPFDAPGIRDNLSYEIMNPNTREAHLPPAGRCWRTEKAKFEELLNDGRIVFGKTGDSRPQLKVFYQEKKQFGEVPTSWFSGAEYGTSTNGTQELQDLFEGDSPFTFPKPTKLIKAILRLTTRSDDLVADFFVGSGTTAHAVMAINCEDGSSRRFIVTQLPEALEEGNSLQSAGLKLCRKLSKPATIAELTKERLRRAGRKLKADNSLFAGDLGFRVFKLDSTNIREWDPDGVKIAESLEAHVEHIKASRSEQDILFELLLKLGLDLCVPIETRKIAGKDVHSIGAGALIACLSPAVGQNEVEALAQGIVAWHKELKSAGESTLVFRDNAFSDDIAKTNLTSILNQNGLHNVRSL